MSSLTATTSTTSSTEEYSDTWLSLGIGAPAPARARSQDGLFPQSQEAPGEGSARARGSVATTTTSRRKRSGGDGDRRSPSDGADDAGSSGARKKLRLTMQQATLLEESFRARNIISHDEKHGLARELGLKPRQVEVWFQNRRARTKLKQTEIDCELLRRWCERLSDENARLRRDLADARSRTNDDASTVIAACASCSKLALVSGRETAA